MPASLGLADTLLETTGIAEDDLRQAMRRQQETGRSLTELLVEQGLVPEGELLTTLGETYAIKVRDTLKPEDVDVELIAPLPIGFAKQHHLLPLRLAHGVLEVAISDPLLTDPLDDLRLLYRG